MKRMTRRNEQPVVSFPRNDCSARNWADPVRPRFPTMFLRYYITISSIEIPVFFSRTLQIFITHSMIGYRLDEI